MYGCLFVFYRIDSTFNRLLSTDFGSYILAFHDALQIARLVHVEHIYWQLVFLTESEGGEVHNFEVLGESLLEREVLIFGGRGVFLDRERSLLGDINSVKKKQQQFQDATGPTSQMELWIINN